MRSTSRSHLFEYDAKILLAEGGPPGGLIGVDEAGRGALAGPVVAAACWFSEVMFSDYGSDDALEGLNDSKKLSKTARKRSFETLGLFRERGLCQFAIGTASVEEIERLNVLGATRLAMSRAIEGVLEAVGREKLSLLRTDDQGFELFEKAADRGNPQTFAELLVDGRPLRPFPWQHQALVKGDGRSLSIASASIIAKYERDQLMVDLGKRFPAYGFARHAGYGTQMHREVLRQLGPSPEHRKLFLRKIFSGAS